jgi:CMP/dCMP kinase
MPWVSATLASVSLTTQIALAKETQPVIVAIDGPAASGKSTVARLLAERLHLAYLDTGAMYRALAVEAVRRGIDLHDDDALTRLAGQAAVSFRHEDGSPLPTQVLVDGRDVTREIRTPEADLAVSPVSAVAGVRSAMVEQQRRIAGAEPDTVLEGRDIGTVVFPRAEVKVFLTALPEERARRRAIDMDSRGAGMTVEDVLKDLLRRDDHDSSRVASPLAKAEDAVVLDTTGMTIDHVVDRIATIVAQRRAESAGDAS